MAEKIEEIKDSLSLRGHQFTPDDKFKFLELCAKEFDRNVPNSQLFEVNTIGMYIYQKKKKTAYSF